ncbi:MAG: alkaline phosphatase [Cyclobacteriaceae bacterium]|jgi:alkaline phosphatase
MNKFINILCVSVIAVYMVHCTSKEVENKPTNIILLIGDGMGLSQISAGVMESEQTLNFERFKSIGLSKTSSSSHKITDSAAGATALSIGEKTYNQAIGVDSDTIPKETIMEWCSKNGYETGCVVTSSITHATPASFYAHQPFRSMNEEIALDLLNAPLDFIAGGGLTYFMERSDQRNLIQELSDAGVDIRQTTADFPESIEKVGQKICYLLAEDGMMRAENRMDYLRTFSGKAIDYLSASDSGFFLLIEGSQIDWGGHNNDVNYVVNELIDFDKAVGLCLDYAEKNPNTLVIVTADHETGGLSLRSETGKYEGLSYTFSTGGHTASMVPVFAFGKNAELFQGIYENTEIYQKMMTALH